jgi:hypothetical protein
VVEAYEIKVFWRVDEPLVKRLLVNRLVVEAEVVTKSEDAVVEAKVEEAVERKPFRKARVVLVACSPVPSFVKGQANVIPVR